MPCAKPDTPFAINNKINACLFFNLLMLYTLKNLLSDNFFKTAQKNRYDLISNLKYSTITHIFDIGYSII